MLDRKICILIVDDEHNIVRALKDFFAAKKFAVLEAFDGEQGLNLALARKSEIDLIVLDVMMPKCDGFSLLRQIREQGVNTPVIMLTAKSESYDELTGFSLGADDYVAKPFSPSVLLARVQALLKRVGKGEQDTFKAGAITLDQSARLCTLDGAVLELTKREFDLLCFFMRSERTTLSREQLLNTVWGYDFDGDVRTVDTHVKQLRVKLLHCAGYIRTVHRVGYCFEVLS